jgi:hypothetical protein
MTPVFDISKAYAYRPNPAANRAEQSRFFMALELRVADAMRKEGKPPAPADRIIDEDMNDRHRRSAETRRRNAAHNLRLIENKIIASIRRYGPMNAKRIAPCINLSGEHTRKLAHDMVAKGMLSARTEGHSKIFEVRA